LVRVAFVHSFDLVAFNPVIGWVALSSVSEGFCLVWTKEVICPPLSGYNCTRDFNAWVNIMFFISCFPPIGRGVFGLLFLAFLFCLDFFLFFFLIVFLILFFAQYSRSVKHPATGLG